MLERAKKFMLRYERYVSPVTLVLGFAFDSIMLKRIDLFFSNALLISYLFIASVCIIFLNVRETRRTKPEIEHSETMHIALLFMMQFSIGGLFSASFLFYSKSGTIIASWPFLLLIFAYVIGNELLRKNYVRLGFQVTVFFTALFSFLIFFLPVILGAMGDAIFMLSGIASLVLTGLFYYVLSWFAPERATKGAPLAILSILSVFAVINALYFSNLIPPIPLSLRDVGVYRSVSKISEGAYEVMGEKQGKSWILSRKTVVHMTPGEPLYALTSVFAPTSLTTEIRHVWRHFDGDRGEWIVASDILLSIKGGREGGFRTYSVKKNVFPGTWRLDVETVRGQLIGRFPFEIRLSTGEEKLFTETK
ncbi:MAG: DUF2914 domain-containing protein [Candidatus Taylorbacteria bacterium]|nr:DUF2914 domain-containing protein [Candidatus Taylorbacteria bacterium]